MVRGDYSSDRMERLRLKKSSWIAPYDCCRERAKVSYEVSYILFAAAAAAAACLQQMSTMKGEWILSELMQAQILNRELNGSGNWLALSPVTSITTHNHSRPLPLVALHMKSKSKHLSHSQRDLGKSVEGLRT
jgi:hypothetical protein